LENLKERWKGHNGGIVEDQADDEYDEEEHSESLSQAGEDDEDSDIEQWEDADRQGGDDDPFSSVAMSRRADEILANAKKRLHVSRSCQAYYLRHTDSLESSWKEIYVVPGPP